MSEQGGWKRRVLDNQRRESAEVLTSRIESEVLKRAQVLTLRSSGRWCSVEAPEEFRVGGDGARTPLALWCACEDPFVRTSHEDLRREELSFGSTAPLKPSLSRRPRFNFGVVRLSVVRGRVVEFCQTQC